MATRMLVNVVLSDHLTGFP